MDTVMEYDEFVKMSDDEVFALLESMFPEKGLYKMSVDWRNSRKYILKAKGAMGDVVIGWK